MFFTLIAKHRYILGLVLTFPLCLPLHAQLSPRTPTESEWSVADRLDHLCLNARKQIPVNLDSALSIIQEAFEIRERTFYKAQDYTLYQTRGTIRAMKGDYEAALYDQLVYLELAEDEGDTGKICLGLVQMANIHFRQGDHEKYLDLVNRASAIDSATVARFSGTQAKVAYVKGDYDLAANLLREWVNEIDHRPQSNPIQKLNGTTQKAFAYAYLSLVYAELQVPDSAIYYGGKCLAFAGPRQNNRALSIANSGIGQARRQLGDPIGARDALATSLHYARKVSSNQQLSDAYKTLSELSESGGDFREAKLYQDSFLLMQERMYGIEKARNIRNLTARYETEKKDRQIAQLDARVARNAKWRWTIVSGAAVLILLAALIAIRIWTKKTQNEARFAMRRAQLEQQVLRARMNPHFLFNALTNLQAVYDKGEKDRADELLASFSRLIRMILEQTEHSLISLRDEIDSLSLYLQIESERFEQNLNYRLEVDPDIEPDDLYLPPSLVQPIVENAIWHGIAPISTGKIRIQFRRHGPDQIQCTVTDNGVGITDGSETGKNLEAHVSMGIHLTMERLGGPQNLLFERPVEGGTKVTLIIPTHEEV